MATEELELKQESNMLRSNAWTLKNEMDWLKRVLDTRMNLYFGRESEYKTIYDVPMPDLTEDPSFYARVIRHYQMSLEDRIMVLVALAPEACPQLLDSFLFKNEMHGQVFTEFGGVMGKIHRGFLPTCETVAFLIAANDLTLRFQMQHLLDEDYYLFKHKILLLEREHRAEPFLSGTLRVTEEYLSYFTTGSAYRPRFSMEFPAKRLYTQMEWQDLVVDNQIRDQIDEIMVWVKHSTILMEDWGLRKKIKPGYRGLFYGPPGTGKTMTASLLGKYTGLDVYRIDISKLVSKYIGETEKNLANIFDQAENKNWILFFDEADALFGKRTNTSDAKDRYANQEVAYLLQRIEDFPGVILLSSNLKSNIDVAFIRRFQSLIYFKMPGPEQRYSLWKKAFEGTPVEDGIDFKEIARDFEVAGGVIINVLRYCALCAVERDEPLIYYEDIEEGVRKEMRKEGKTV